MSSRSKKPSERVDIDQKETMSFHWNNLPINLL